ncbi:thrombospondin type 3 repeat-containing protein [Microbulbifer pacificus]|uniref:Thrombospondin type 3 repeat-containing protein n=1 Tax=Microbulbifer pacificus TaxID=407164 RepID=A0AAU0MXE2_9GAMM|nr:thrombospondin type 3 repeat-containing protein [Microbulbifer pacificus]WOX04415.1 thrombospondin type 3 repeat-containing protein [Microbulbifer pacificus]
MKKLSFLPLIVSLAACGGGGGSDNASEDQGGNGSGGQGLSAPSIKLSSTLGDITRENTPKLARVVVDLLHAGRDVHQIWDRGQYFNNFTRGEESGSCEGGGKYKIRLSDDGKRLRESYDNCSLFDYSTQQEITVNGDMQTDFSGIDASGNFQVNQIYRDYKITEGSGQWETVDAIIAYKGNNIADSGVQPQVTLTLRAVNSIEGTINAEDFRISITDSLDFISNLNGAVGVGGAVEYVGIGTTQLGFDENRGSFLLSGSGNDRGEVAIRYGAVDVLFDAGGDDQSEYGLRIPMGETGGIPLFGTEPSQPYVQTQQVGNQERRNVDGNATTSVSVLPNFGDAGGRLLGFTLQVDAVRLQGRPDDYHTPPAEELPFEYTITQPVAGLFRIETHGDLGADVAAFEATFFATNALGNESNPPLPAMIYLYRDTDSDGIADFTDDDDDNDGVPDHRDALPRDPTETEDADGDGIGDNADLDDDNDGIEDTADFYPYDRYCYLEADGDGERCLLHSVGGNSYGKILDRNGIVYFYKTGSLEVKRWDSLTQHFLPSIHLEPASVGSVGQFNTLYYAEPQHALYIKYDDRVYSRIGLNATTLVENFYVRGPSTEEAWELYGVDFAENYVVLLGQSTNGYERYSYDLTGALGATYSEARQHYDATQYRYVDSARFCTIGYKLDVVTGGFIDIASGSDFDGPCGYMRIQTGRQPIVSPDGTRAVISGGVIINADQEVVGTGNVSFRTHDIGWTNAGIYYLNSTAETLDRYDNNGELLESLPLERQETVGKLLINDDHLIWFDGALPKVVRLPLSSSKN